MVLFSLFNLFLYFLHAVGQKSRGPAWECSDRAEKGEDGWSVLEEAGHCKTWEAVYSWNKDRKEAWRCWAV